VGGPLAQAEGAAAIPVDALLDGVQGIVQLQASASSAHEARPSGPAGRK
jgi:hypothetical protein